MQEATKLAEQQMQLGELRQLARDPRDSGDMVGLFVGSTIPAGQHRYAIGSVQLPPEMFKGVEPKLVVYFPETGVVFTAAQSTIPLKGMPLYPVHTFNIKDPAHTLQTGLGIGGPLPGFPGHNYFVNVRGNVNDLTAVAAQAMTDPTKMYVLGTGNIGLITGSACPPDQKTSAFLGKISDTARAGVGFQVQLGLQGGEVMVRSPNGWLPLSTIAAGMAVMAGAQTLTDTECRRPASPSEQPDKQQIQKFLDVVGKTLAGGAAAAAAVLEWLGRQWTEQRL